MIWLRAVFSLRMRPASTAETIRAMRSRRSAWSMWTSANWATGPAGALVAAFLGAGQVEVVTQRVEQGHPTVQPQPPGAPVDVQ